MRFTRLTNEATEKVYHIGGNAALMGIRFAAEGANVLLGGAIGPEAAKLISEARVSEKMSFASNVCICEPIEVDVI